ncbi:MAG: riboflavin synthase [Candidatus Heimdallarchaeaceae archaeon]
MSRFFDSIRVPKFKLLYNNTNGTMKVEPMFTGIIEEIGLVNHLHRSGSQCKIEIKARTVLQDIRIGESISVNGVCLTVTGFTSTAFTADMMPETLERTNLKFLQRGSFVNLERALKLQDRLNGHFVQGHVDAMGEIVKKETKQNSIIFKIKTRSFLLNYIVPKGSIAIDGVSLTVVGVYKNSSSFTVSIIPHTLENTIMRQYSIGSVVNVECDILSKYVEHLLQKFNEEKRQSIILSKEFLFEHSF